MEDNKVLKRTVVYKDSNDESMEGILFTKSSIDLAAGTVPAIIVFHAFEGITAFEEEQGTRLLQYGCVAFCADIYGTDNKADSDKGWFTILNKFKNDRAGLLRRHLLAAVDYVKSLEFVDKSRIGAIGFCFGGMCVLDLARINAGLSAVASFHGSFNPLPDQSDFESLHKIDTTILVCHGDADLHITQETWIALMEELRKRKANWHFINHGNAKHSFTHPNSDLRNTPGVGYNQEAAELSWIAMINLFSQRYITKLEIK